MPKLPLGASGSGDEEAWEELVEGLERRGHLKSTRLRAAMASLPRWEFLGDQADPETTRRAARDAPVGIGHGQTISAPHMVAILLETAGPQLGDRCLEVGAGSGWLAAVLAELVGTEGHVVAMEVVPELANLARANLEAHELDDQVEVVLGDGSLGYPAGAPYDVITLSCAAPAVPDPLEAQLHEGGRLVIPLGDRNHQRLYRFTKTPDGLREEALGGCRFVPLVGEHGFS